jgi:hypothetical protein
VRLFPPAAVLIAAAALLAACASSTAPQPAPSSPPAGAATTQHGDYAVCLAEHGVPTPPAGPGAPPGVDQQTWAKAQQACVDKAPGPTG